MITTTPSPASEAATTLTLTHADLLERIEQAPQARVYARSRYLWIELDESILELELELEHQDPQGRYLGVDAIDPAWTGSGLELSYEDLPEDAYTGASTPEGIWDLIPTGTHGRPIELVADEDEDEDEDEDND